MKVISIITNNPIFIELQYKSLKKYLHTDYEYIVFNDGKSWTDSTNFGNPIENGKIAIENKYAINNKERPNYLSRSKNLSGSLDELPKPKFIRSVKGKPC